MFVIDRHSSTVNSHSIELLKTQVDQRLGEVFQNAENQAMDRAKESLPMLTHARELTMRGGKRLRPALLFAAVQSITDASSLSQAIIDVSCAIELLQTYLLIHDDWMDQDEVRRGGPTVHVSLARHFGNAHLGASVAILAGDFTCALAQDLAASKHVPADRLFDVLRAFVQMQREVVLGQTLDVLNSSDLEAIHDLKTGSYTVRGPIALGHRLAGGSDEQWSVLAAFSNPLGVAFQLRDDLIGAFGDEKETGKSAASDLRQAKMSAPVRWALERLDDAGQTALKAVLGTDDVARAQQLLNQAGAREGVEARIAELKAQCLAALDTKMLRPQGRELLASLAQLLCDRRK
jgi:geranylgeranyl diphosphate synthase type I